MSQARWCNGCATGSNSSPMRLESQPMAEAADPDTVPVPGARLHRAWRALLGCRKCRGAVFGLTRNSGPKEFAKAALQSVGYQTRDLLTAMQDDAPKDGENVLRVDGGMAASDWTMQFLADILGAEVDRPTVCRNHRPRCGVARRNARRPISIASRVCQNMGRGNPLHPKDVIRNERCKIRWLARCRQSRFDNWAIASATSPVSIAKAPRSSRNRCAKFSTSPWVLPCGGSNL